MLAVLIPLFSIFSADLQSQTPASAPVPENWWRNSPFTSPDSLNRLLFHGEGTLAYNNMTGNFESNMIQCGTEIDLRKDHATGSVSVMYNKQRTKQGPVENSMSYFLFQTKVEWDFQSYLTGEAGVMWEKNELHMLENQYLPYVGVGTRWAITPAQQFNVFVAGGRVFPTYTVPISYFGMKEGAYNGMHISQSYHLGISPAVGFDESFVHLRNLVETKRYSTNITLRLSTAISSYLKIMLEYSHMLSTEAGFVGASEVDTGQSVGINLAI